MSEDLRLIGGEMATWSDRRPDARPPAGGPVLAELVGRLARSMGGRVLVAGPHEDALVDAVAAHASVTCLLRSQPDAAAMAARGVGTLCGTLAKLADADCYDVVVALDGLDRLCSVEGPQYDWAESLQALRRLLRPGGALVLAVENELGVHRLVASETATSAHTEAAWRPLGEFDTKPANPARLAARLAADGLAVCWLAAAWPLPQAPTLLATPDALRDGPVSALSAAATGAVARAYGGRPVLSDPRRLAAVAVRGGLGTEFAASWLAIAHRAPRSTPGFVPPPVLLGDGPVMELAHDGNGSWVRRIVGGRAEPGRNVSRLDGPLPRGRLLEELLIAACLRHDLPALRRVLTGWATWLGTLHATDRMSATADNVLLDGEAYGLLDPSWRAAPMDLPTATGTALRRFAETLLAGGYAHPWPVATDVDSLTAILAGAAGLELDRTHQAPAGADRAVLPDSLREQREQLRALREQLADATARAQWYSDELERREVELRRAQLQIAAFSGSLGYRATRLGVRTLRLAHNVLRRARR